MGTRPGGSASSATGDAYEELGLSARAIAFRTLVDWEPHLEFVSERLEGLISEAEASERGLARELTLGTIRRLATLDALISPHVDRPRERVERGLWTLLRIGTYQLTFLAGMADHAAVHETVELGKRIEPRWAGFLNAILRKVAGSLTNDVLSMPTADGVPLADGRYRLLTSKLFSDPDDEPVEYFAAAFSYPAWLARRWGKRFEPNALFAIGMAMNRPPRLTLRANRLKNSRDALLEQFKEAGIRARAGRHPESIQLREQRSVATIPGFAEGAWSVQDETAMAAGTLLAPTAGARVWDVCAAPGTKTTHLAEMMGDQGRLLATDVQAARLERVVENRERLGLSVIETRVLEGGDTSAVGEEFDFALVDAPCSNTGVLGKRAEARWRVGRADLRELPKVQAGLLEGALARLAPGGRVVYSTCSIEPEENEQVVQRVLQGREDARLLESRLYLPGEPSDGGFQALIERLGN